MNSHELKSIKNLWNIFWSTPAGLLTTTASFGREFQDITLRYTGYPSPADALKCKLPALSQSEENTKPKQSTFSRLSSSFELLITDVFVKN